MTLSQADRYARIMLALFVLAGVLYSVVSPVLENPDEIYHYPLVKHLADGHALPVQRADVETTYAQEGSQPPLYYALMAALTAWIDTDDLATLRYLNPHAQVGIPLADGNKNIVVHTDQERWPWRGAALAIHLIRLISLAMGATSAWCGYRLARRLFGSRPVVAVGALVFMAFNPMFVFISASVNNDNLIILLTGVTLLMLVRLLEEPCAEEWEGDARVAPARHGSKWFCKAGLKPPAWPCLATLGVLCGLAALSKLSGLLLLPLCGLALALRAWLDWRAQRERSLWPFIWRMLAQLALVGLIAALVAGWWYARNLRLYGELTGTQTMLDIFGRRQGKVTPVALWQEFGGFRMSFWGLFGYFNVLLRPLWLYTLLDALSLAGCLGLVVWLWRERRGEVAAHWPALALLAALGLAFGLALLRWTSMTLASQGRLIFPVLPAIALFLSLGLLSYFRRAQQPWVVLGLAVALSLLTLSAPWAAIAPAYRRPPVMTRAEIPAALPRVEATFQNEIRLVAYDLSPHEVAPGEPISLTLFWESLRPATQHHSVYIHVFGLDQVNMIAQRDSFPGRGSYTTVLWQPGDVIRDHYELMIAPDTVGPVAPQIAVGLYDLSSMSRLPVKDGHGQPVDRVLLGRIKIIAPPDAPRPTPDHALDALLGENVRLYGYDLPITTARPGDQIPLTLYWEPLVSLSTDYTVFVHLVDADGALLGQGDGPPLDDQYPTSYWAAGECLRDEHLVTLDADALPGRAQLLVGLYNPETGERLSLGANSDGAIALATLEVTR